MDKQKDFCTTKCRSLFYFQAAARACGRGRFYSFGQMAMRSARARGRAGFFFKLVLALVARGWFFLLVKWLALRAGQSAGLVFSFGQMACAPRGPEVGLVFSLSWFARWWRGAVFSFGQMACAPRGPEVGRGVSNPPSLPLDSTLPATS